MALLLFPPDALEPQLAALLDPNLRRDAAAQVNKVILERQALGRESAIRNLVKMRAWAETTARGKDMALPEHLDIGLRGDDGDDVEAPYRRESENGHDSMMMT